MASHRWLASLTPAKATRDGKTGCCCGGTRRLRMAKKIINLLILLPVGIILIIFCVANRQLVTLAFNPFRPEDQVLSLSAPLFVFLFGTLVVGMVVGSAATWFTQGRHRKRARTEAREAVRWQTEAERHRNRAEQIAGQLPAK
jgi:uncharacterized integral membrane protein